jgi:quinol monooxygenase YgiN
MVKRLQGWRTPKGRRVLAIGRGWSTIPAVMAKRKAKRARTGSRPRRSGSRRSVGASVKLPKDAATLLVILRPREGQDVFLEAELRALIGPTRKEDGCLRYDVFRSSEGPAAYLLYEIWESRNHYTAHTKTDHFLRWNARKDSLLASREVGFWKQIA